VLVLAVLAAGCTDYPGGAPRSERPTPPPSVPTAPSLSAATSPPPWVTDDPDAISTRPLVFAINPHRPPLDLTERQAQRLRDGTLHRWIRLGQPGGRLVSTDSSPDLAHLPMNAVAVVVADAVSPAVRVATVDGIDPLRDPASYPVQVQGPAPAPVTVRVGRGDRRVVRIFWGKRLMAIDPPVPRRAPRP
jgi:hypothetical protein